MGEAVVAVGLSMVAWPNCFRGPTNGQENKQIGECTKP